MSTTIFLIPFINIETLLQFIIGSDVSSQETDPPVKIVKTKVPQFLINKFGTFYTINSK